MMKEHYRGTTRTEMERAGRAIPKRTYQCTACGFTGAHDAMHHHQLEQCTEPKGRTA